MLENFSRRKLIIIGLVILAVGILSWIFYLAMKPTTGDVNLPIGNNDVSDGRLPNNTGGRDNINNTPINFPPDGDQNLPGDEGGVNQPIDELNLEPSLIAIGGETSAPALTPSVAQAPNLSSGGVRYYNPNDCKFYEITNGGSHKTLTNNSYCGVSNITWSPQGNQTILEFPDGANVIYDFVNKKQVTLPREMTEFSWSPDSSKIAGKFLDDNPADRWLVTIGSDGGGLTGIEPMGENADKVDVEWAPNNQVMALSRTGEPSGLFQQQVLLIGFNGENFKGLYINGRGFEPRWSPDGTRLLYSSFSDKTDYKPQLYLVDASVDRVGAHEQVINLKTWVDKCTLVTGFAYCAVPNELPDGVGFSRELAAQIPDTLWRIDLATGGTTILARPVNESGREITALNLQVSADSKFLYFTEGSSGRLRSVQLK